MKIRYKSTGSEDYSSQFNVHAIGEILTHDDSPYIRELDVQLPDGTWKDMSQAFRDKDIVPNNHNTHFGPPINEECKQRGYNP